MFGLLAGYALARLHFRGRGSLFAAMLLVQVIPFQLLMIPLYVMIVRSYGLADSYLGMIAPFAINATAVFVFRQFFLQLPEDLFSAARIDGASELRILWSIALPLVRPAVLTAVLLTFIGPWNEFLWPFLITKDADLQPLAVSLANYIEQRRRTCGEPLRRDPRRRLRAGCARRHPLHGLPEALHRDGHRVRSEGMTSDDSSAVPYTMTRLGVVMTPEPGNPHEAMGVLNPASGRAPDGRLYLLPRLVEDGNISRVGLAEVELRDGVPVGVQRRGVVLAPDEGWERGANNAGVEDPRTTWVPSLGRHLMTYVAFGPLGPRLALAVSEDLEHWQRLGPVQFGYQPGLDTDLCMFPNKDAVFFPEVVPDPDGRPSYAMLHRPMWDLGWFREGETVHLPAGITDERPGIWISYVPADARRGRHPRPRTPGEPPLRRAVRVPLRGAEDRRRAASGARRRGLAAHPPRRVRREARRLRPHDAEGRVRRGGDAARRR